MIIFDDDIDLCSINSKYINRNYTLSNKYRDFKTELQIRTCKFRFSPPFRVSIWVKTLKDIDAAVKPILDGIEYCLGNDKHVMELFVYKELRKRKEKEHLTIGVEEI